MKCIKLLDTGKIYRVSDVMAATVIAIGKAVYVSKKEWEEAGRLYTKTDNIKKRRNNNVK